MDPGLYAASSAGNIDETMKFKDKILYQVTEGTHHTVLHLAALSNNAACVYAILEEFPSLLDKVNSRNETALHLAAGEGYTDVVKVLLNKAFNGLDSNEISCPRFDFIRRGNVELDTALHLAVRNNHNEVVRLIVAADPDDKHTQNLNFETPLYLAAIAGSFWITKIILKTCRNPSMDGPDGRTALHAAVISRKNYSVSDILEWRPDILERGDNKGWTAFHYAASLNSLDALDMLIERGINPLDPVVALDLFVQRGIKLENRDSVVAAMRKTSDDSKKTAHHIAAYEGHIYILTQLMEYCPAASEEVDEDGRNILHMAAEQKHKDLIQSILEDFPDVVYELVNMQDKNGNTPLHLLVIAGCFVPQLLTHHPFARYTRNKDNFTPEELLYMNEDIVGDELMIKNALVNTKFNSFRYFWHEVTNWGWLKQFNLWLRKIKSNKRRRTVWDSMVQESKRRRKDAKFKVANTKIMKEEVELYRGRTNTQIIVTALIATVTFTVGFTMPGGNHDGDTGDAYNGLAILSKRKAFNICMVADAVGLLFSISSLFLYFISSLYQDPHEVSKFISASTGFNIVSVIAMMLTFITGTYVVLSHSPVLVTVSVISCMFFLLVIILLIKLKCDPKEKFKL